MRAFVINLERSTSRREFMQKALDEQGIDFEFVKAVDGAALTDEAIEALGGFAPVAERPYELRRGACGCILSHYSIYQRIVDENLPYALVMEDDIVLQPGLKQMLDALATKIQTNEAILLFTQNNYMPIVFSSQQAEALPGKHQLMYPMNPWAFNSAAAYIISREAAQGMLKLMIPLRYFADAWGAFYENNAIAVIRCVTPFVAKPAGFKSDIDYIKSTSFQGRVLAVINKYRVFPFKQLLDYRRQHLLDKITKYSFTTEPSTVATLAASRQGQLL